MENCCCTVHITKMHQFILNNARINGKHIPRTRYWIKCEWYTSVAHISPMLCTRWLAAYRCTALALIPRATMVYAISLFDCSHKSLDHRRPHIDESSVRSNKTSWKCKHGIDTNSRRVCARWTRCKCRQCRQQ